MGLSFGTLSLLLRGNFSARMGAAGVVYAFEGFEGGYSSPPTPSPRGRGEGALFIWIGYPGLRTGPAFLPGATIFRPSGALELALAR